MRYVAKVKMSNYIIKTKKGKDEVIDILKANTHELNEKSMGKLEWSNPITKKYFCGKIDENNFKLKRCYDTLKMDYRSLIKGYITQNENETEISIRMTPSNGFIFFYAFILVLAILLCIVCREELLESIRREAYFDLVLIFCLVVLLPIIMMMSVFYIEKYTTIKKFKMLLLN